MATFVKPKRNSGVASIKGADELRLRSRCGWVTIMDLHCRRIEEPYPRITIVSLGRNIPLNKTDNNTASGSKDYLTWHYVFNFLIQILNGHAAMEDNARPTLTYLDKIDSEKSRPYLTLCPVQAFRPIHQLESTRLFLPQTLGDPNLEASASGSGW
ncbi:hypothetical protein BU17DRAFT_104331 [Hysterangium stoloniferum]|nr:hypothetical protein BU17DRAFT_104331 [Hysterangium stoloniferum]